MIDQQKNTSRSVDCSKTSMVFFGCSLSLQFGLKFISSIIFLNFVLSETMCIGFFFFNAIAPLIVSPAFIWLKTTGSSSIISSGASCRKLSADISSGETFLSPPCNCCWIREYISCTFLVFKFVAEAASSRGAGGGGGGRLGRVIGRSTSWICFYFENTCLLA